MEDAELNMVESMAFYKNTSNCYCSLVSDHNLEHRSYDSCQINWSTAPIMSNHRQSKRHWILDCLWSDQGAHVRYFGIYSNNTVNISCERKPEYPKKPTTFGRALTDSRQESNRRPLRWKALALIIARLTSHGMALLLCSSHNYWLINEYKITSGCFNDKKNLVDAKI